MFDKMSKLLFVILLLSIAYATSSKETQAQKTSVPVVYVIGVPSTCVAGKIYVNSTTGFAYTFKTGTGCFAIGVYSGGTITSPIVGPDGTETNPTYSFASDTNTGIAQNGVADNLIFIAGGATQLRVTAGVVRIFGTTCYSWASGNPSSTSGDAFFCRDSADTFAFRNGANPQRVNIANTFTSAANREDLSFYFTSNIGHIGTTTTGATARALQIDYGGTTTAAISIPITSGVIAFGGGITASTFNGADLTGAWTSYTPTFACSSGTPTTTTNVGRYKQIGKSIFFTADITITTVGTCAGTLFIGIPATSGTVKYGGVSGIEVGVNNKSITGYVSNGEAFVRANFYDGTTAATSGNRVVVGGTYEIP